MSICMSIIHVPVPVSIVYLFINSCVTLYIAAYICNYTYVPIYLYHIHKTRI